jgi:hypothetical protein
MCCVGASAEYVFSPGSCLAGETIEVAFFEGFVGGSEAVDCVEC